MERGLTNGGERRGSCRSNKLSTIVWVEYIQYIMIKTRCYKQGIEVKMIIIHMVRKLRQKHSKAHRKVYTKE